MRSCALPPPSVALLVGGGLSAGAIFLFRSVIVVVIGAVVIAVTAPVGNAVEHRAHQFGADPIEALPDVGERPPPGRRGPRRRSPAASAGCPRGPRRLPSWRAPSGAPSAANPAVRRGWGRWGRSPGTTGWARRPAAPRCRPRPGRPAERPAPASRPPRTSAPARAGGGRRRRARPGGPYARWPRPG